MAKTTARRRESISGPDICFAFTCYVTSGLYRAGHQFWVFFWQTHFFGKSALSSQPCFARRTVFTLQLPGFFNGQYSFLPVNGPIVPSTWQQLAHSGDQAFFSLGDNWLPLFLGREIGSIGTSSTLAALLGLLVLIVLRHLPWRIPIGALMGFLVTWLCLNGQSNSTLWTLSWLVHLLVGNFIFTLIFVATDPKLIPLSRYGTFIYGGVFGFLTALLRIAHPNHPEATYSALLLASLLIPLIDWLVINAHRQLRQRLRHPTV